MDLIVYYEGADSIKDWITSLLGQTCEFRAIPTTNNSEAFARLPSYIADILYLDKPDLIISGVPDGIHERPIFSIELAACTPQYQHAIQRFSRMVASVSNLCPSILIMAKRKVENDGGVRMYNRSAAVDYGAVRLMDIFAVPALVVDWPDKDGTLLFEGADTLPPLSSPEMKTLATFLRQAVKVFPTLDYIGALTQLALTQQLVDATRARAYVNGAPSIASPGGATGRGANLELVKTVDLVQRLLDEGRATAAAIAQLPPHFLSREYSLLFFPTRVVKKAGDPYVGMLTYYDIAFCRTGLSPRDRRYNLVAYCNGVSIQQTLDVMKTFNNRDCPFNRPLVDTDILRYSYHLRDGCKKTKNKPTRIYAEVADMVAYTDNILVSP